MRRKRKTDQDIIKEIVDKMFSIAGHNVTYEDVLGRKDQWYYDWDMTPEQEQQWMDWMVDFLRKERGLTKEYARRSAAMYNLMWGLRVVHSEIKQSELECKFGFDSCANNQLAMCEKCDEGENYEIKKTILPVSMHKSQVKQCALKAVDAIMEELTVMDYGLQYLNRMAYWNEVKEEIEKL